LINTGNGKGKTTAAIGTAVRALGHGQKVVFLQFIKSAPTGESRFLERYAQQHPDRLCYHMLGLGFIKNDPSAQDLAKANQAMEMAEKLQPNADLIVLDEINIALSKGLILVERVKKFLLERPESQNVILTGRNCPDELYEMADTITEMTEIKHAYRQGKPAAKGVDF
jgi:cob(I)alamin adenosyltransferase